MHVKDAHAETNINFTVQQDPAPVGDGRIDLARLLPNALVMNVTDFLIEKEPPFKNDRFDDLARILAFVRTI